MFDRLTRHLKKSLRTEVPSSLATGTLGSRNPSCVSVQQVSFLKNDMVGLRQPRYYNDMQVTLERTNSHYISPSKKAATTYFTRESRLPHWVDPEWVRPTRQLFDRIKHPDWWKAYQEDLKRPRDTSVGMTDYVVDPNEAPGDIPFPISHQNTAKYPTIDETFEQDQAKAREPASRPLGPSAQSKQPRTKKLPPRFGRLQKRDEAHERDFVTTIDSFVSRVTRRVMDHFERRTLDSKGRPVRRRLKKGDRFPVQTDIEDETNTLVVEPSSTVHLPVEVPSPGTLNTELNTSPHKHTPKRPSKRFTKPHPATASPARSIQLSDPSGAPDKEIGRRPSYQSTYSRLSSLGRKTPSPHASHLSSLCNPFSIVTSAPKIDTKIDAEPVDWGAALSQGGESPASETGKSCISGSTLVGGSKEGSVSSACDYRTNPLKHSAASIAGLQRGESGASMGSWTTAGSMDYRKSHGPQLVSNPEKDFENPGHSQFTLVPNAKSDIPLGGIYLNLAASFKARHEAKIRSMQPLTPYDLATCVKYHHNHFPQSRCSDHSAWEAQTSGVMA
jgi:hypothetical protein